MKIRSVTALVLMCLLVALSACGVDKDDPYVQFNYGQQYEYGGEIDKQAVAIDKKVAAEWYLKAANQGHSVAMVHLAILQLEDEIGSADKYSVFKWLKQGDLGDATVQYHLAHFYLGEMPQYKLGAQYESIIDQAKGLDLLNLAAMEGHAQAQYSLGRYFAKGMFVEKDLEQAVKWLAMAADQNNWAASLLNEVKSAVKSQELRRRSQEAAEAPDASPEAKFTYGNFLYDEKDKNAIAWIQKAADDGLIEAHDRLGGIYWYDYEKTKSLESLKKSTVHYWHFFEAGGMNGEYYYVRSSEELAAVKRFKELDGKVSSQSEPALQFEFANLILRKRTKFGGLNYAAALPFLEGAAEKGYVKSQVHLGDLYSLDAKISSFNADIKVDLAAALSWYMKAAKQGDYYAQYRVASLYGEEGGSALENEEQAFLWMTKAAEGYPYAKYRLGMDYLKGFGVTKDLKKAEKLLLGAAEENVAAAQFELSQLYENGDYLTKNPAAARYWSERYDSAPAKY